MIYYILATLVVYIMYELVLINNTTLVILCIIYIYI